LVNIKNIQRDHALPFASRTVVITLSLTRYYRTVISVEIVFFDFGESGGGWFEINVVRIARACVVKSLLGGGTDAGEAESGRGG